MNSHPFRQSVFTSTLIVAIASISSSANLSHASTQPYARSVDGCLTSGGSTLQTGETGALSFIKVTGVAVMADPANVNNNLVTITGSDAQYGLPSNWQYGRSNKKIYLQYRSTPTDSAAKVVAQECLNNARIAMANGMNIIVDGNFLFTAHPAWQGCEVKAVQPHSNVLGDLHMCVLQVADPNLKNSPAVSP